MGRCLATSFEFAARCLSGFHRLFWIICTYFIRLGLSGDCFVHYRVNWTVFYWFSTDFVVYFIYIKVSRVLPLAVSLFHFPSVHLKVVFAFYSRSACPIGLEFFVCTSGGAPDLNSVFGRVFPPATADWVIAYRGLRFDLFHRHRRSNRSDRLQELFLHRIWIQNPAIYLARVPVLGIGLVPVNLVSLGLLSPRYRDRCWPPLKALDVVHLFPGGFLRIYAL